MGQEAKDIKAIMYKEANMRKQLDHLTVHKSILRKTGEKKYYKYTLYIPHYIIKELEWENKYLLDYFIKDKKIMVWYNKEKTEDTQKDENQGS